MFRRSTTVLLAALCVTASSALRRYGDSCVAAAAAGAIGTPRPPLFFREDWTGNPAPRGCFNLHDAKCEPALTQAAIANPDIWNCCCTARASSVSRTGWCWERS